MGWLFWVAVTNESSFQAAARFRRSLNFSISWSNLYCLNLMCWSVCQEMSGPNIHSFNDSTNWTLIFDIGIISYESLTFSVRYKNIKYKTPGNLQNCFESIIEICWGLTVVKSSRIAALFLELSIKGSNFTWEKKISETHQVQ